MDTGHCVSIRQVRGSERRAHLGKVVEGRELVGWTVHLIILIHRPEVPTRIRR